MNSLQKRLPSRNKLKISPSPSNRSGKALYGNHRFLVIRQENPYFIAIFVVSHRYWCQDRYMKKQGDPIKEVAYVSSNVDYLKCPEPKIPEYAFIGRSNVGKSSLINMLTMSKKLAMVSAQPGKTKVINHFIVNKEWYLVDLPGYGWAKTSRDERAKWDVMIRTYLTRRPNLACIFLLVDSRHEPQKNDMEFITWMAEQGLPFAIIFTKVDKQSTSKSGTMIAKFEEELLKTWEELPPMIATSSENGTGRLDVLEFIGNANRNYSQNQ